MLRFTTASYISSEFIKPLLFLFLPLLLISVVQQPPVGQGLRIMEASRSHSVTPQSVGVLWTSDQPDAETSS